VRPNYSYTWKWGGKCVHLLSSYISVVTFEQNIWKLLHDGLYHYVEFKSMLSKHQRGFRAKVTIEFAIYDIVECISENLDQKIPKCAVFLDFSKAFDTVDRSVLLWKLEHYYGIRGLPLQVFDNYLHTRKQYAVVKKCRSQTQQINCGLPQGSILSPQSFHYMLITWQKYQTLKPHCLLMIHA